MTVANHFCGALSLQFCCLTALFIVHATFVLVDGSWLVIATEECCINSWTFLTFGMIVSNKDADSNNLCMVGGYTNALKVTMKTQKLMERVV